MEELPQPLSQVGSQQGFCQDSLCSGTHKLLPSPWEALSLQPEVLTSLWFLGLDVSLKWASLPSSSTVPSVLASWWPLRPCPTAISYTKHFLDSDWLTDPLSLSPNTGCFSSPSHVTAPPSHPIPHTALRPPTFRHVFLTSLQQGPRCTRVCF